jgi:serine phosphatase RsbU (regulator of sigma subunit)
MGTGKLAHERQNAAPNATIAVAFGTALVLMFSLLVATGRADFLGYHTVIEFIAASVGVAVFVVAWHTRHLVDDDFLVVLGVAQLFISTTTMMHALTYQGLTVFPGTTVTMSSQFWIITRFMQAAALVAAPAFIGARLKRPSLLLAAFGVPAAAAVYAVFSGVFPITFVSGVGLTPFKVAAEWAIIAGMGLGLWLLWRKRDWLERRVFVDLAVGICCMIAAEVIFTMYATLFGTLNVIGHVLHLASIFFFYRALVARSLEDPFALLFRRLSQREESLREENHFSEGLNRLAIAIGASLNADEILSAAVAEVTDLAGADGATISAIESAEAFRILNVHGPDFESACGLVFDRAQAPHLFLAAESGEPVVILDTRDDPRGRQSAERFGTRSLMSIPLIARGRPNGVMTLYWLEPSESVGSPRLLRFARKIGASLALALTNAHLYEGEHRVAEILQTAMASSLKTTADVEIGSVYRPAPGIGRIGGDFFDVFDLADGSVAFALGDVAGKGIEAAATSTLARTTLRALAYRYPGQPSKVLAGASEALFHQLGSAVFVTAAFGVLDPSSGSVTLGLAGHPEPVVCGRVELVPDEHVRNPPLAVVGDRAFNVWSFTLAPSDTLVLFSDGICEARRGTELFGSDRVRETLATCAGSCQETADRLLAAVEAYSSDGLRDDVAVLALRAPGCSDRGED